MELVSANTKNYLFLTLTQNNETDEMVRARVSMRRDQAFWEGGNSFIACESFRITSAPNEGGLYYQQIPDDFIMSCVRDTGDDTPDAFTPLLSDLAPTGLLSVGAPRVVDKIVTTDLHVRAATTPLTKPTAIAHLSLSDVADAALTETTFDDLVPRLVKYLGQSSITRGSIVRFTDSHNGGARTIDVKITGEPQHGITGPSIGVNGMFIPKITFPDPQNDFICLTPGAPPTSTKGYCEGASLLFSVPHGQKMDANFINNCRDLVRQAPYLHFAGGLPYGAAGLSYHASPFPAGAAFRIMAPQGFQTDIPQANNQFGELVGPISWANNVLKKGDSIKQYTTHWTAGQCTETGKVPVSITDTNFMWQLDIKMTPEFLTNFNSPGPVLNAFATLGESTFMMALKDTVLSRHGFSCYVTGSVTSANDEIDQIVNTVSLATSGPGSEIIINRGNENVTVYTPNEFYMLFNRAGVTDDATPPWLLQTDENGGFAVQWKMDTSKPVTQFSISKSMCDSLGLNPWMDFEQTQTNMSKRKYTVTLLDTNYHSAEESGSVAMASYIVDQPIEACTLYSTGAPPIPAHTDANGLPVARNWVFKQVCNVGRKQYRILSIQSAQIEIGQSFASRLVPQLVWSDNNIQMYQYSGLPQRGQIRNTGQISVESWGTFSMINLVIPNIPFQSMLGGESDARILASLRLPFQYSTNNGPSGAVSETGFAYYGDLLFNSDSSRSYLRITTDQQLFDCDVEARLIRRDGSMEIMQIPYKGQFQVKLRLLQTQ